MATVAERAVGAIVGATVADAAAQPLHWIYKLQTLDSIIASEEAPEFGQPSANPFYRIETGRNSCYGDQAYVILESLAECQGLDIADLKQRMYRMFGPGTDYDDAQNLEYKPHEGVKASYPINGSWRQASIKDFLKNTEAGKDDTGSEEDDQVDGATKVAPLVALYAGQPCMLEKVEDALRVTQNSDTALAAGLTTARILEQFVLYGKRDGVIETVMEEMRKPDRKNPTDLDQAMVSFLQKVLDNRGGQHREVVTTVFSQD
ncbi:Hypp4566 [Branchiostoma lanceolatum]|uniref:Hypp4566 protein n=1 Tax=Branchiostoma lanceolatum TaxID=7740 RepID=A0A8K0ABW5_BRALA|nr:Hypp4566 [Branchiostoma lanceolatum]